MAIAARINKTKEYILEQDRDLPLDQQTAFTLRTLTSSQKAKQMDAMMGSVETEDGQSFELIRPGSGMLMSCKYGIEGWSNFKDEDGNIVEPKIRGRGTDGHRLCDSSLDRIHSFMPELFTAIMKFNSLEGEEPGNSESSLTSIPDTPVSMNGEAS